MFKVLLTFACLFLSFVHADADDIERCRPKPSCCGCEGNPIQQVKLLQKTFMDIVQSNVNTDRVLAMTLPGTEVHLVGEVCPTGGCCSQDLPIAAMLDFIRGSVIHYEQQSFKLLDDASVIGVDMTAFSRFNVSTLAGNCIFKWVPTQNCNYKISHIDFISFACNASSGPCNLCQPVQ